MEKSFEIRRSEGAEGVKFEDVVGRVVSTTAGVNTCSSKNFDHVRDAEVYRIRRGRPQGRRGDVGCRGLRRSSANRATGGQGCEAYDKFFTTTNGMAAKLEELVIKFEWDRLVCKGKGLAIHNCLRLRVKVAWNGRSGVCI